MRDSGTGTADSAAMTRQRCRDASKPVTARTPERPASRASAKPAKVKPSGVPTPTPVIQTALLTGLAPKERYADASQKRAGTGTLLRSVAYRNEVSRRTGERGRGAGRARQLHLP